MNPQDTIRRPHVSDSVASVWLRFVVAYMLLNLPSWVLGHWFYINRPVFDVELVLPLLLAPLSTPLALMALVVNWLLDVAVSQSRSYHFSSPLEFVRSAQFLTSVQLRNFVTLHNLALAVPFVASAAAALQCAPRRRVPWVPALVAVLFLCVMDVGNGSSMLSNRASRLISTNIAGSPVTTLVVRAWEERHVQPLARLPEGASAVGRSGLFAWTQAHPDASALLVVVESMGYHHDERIRAWLRSQLFDTSLDQRYILHEDAIPFLGSTTSAELRELCGLTGSYRSLDANAGRLCLPSRLLQQGWQVSGVHGFSGHMFDRIEWWPLTGLQETLFAEDLLSPAEPRCGGAFAGVCDADLIRTAISRLAKGHSFAYALTLNSHLPLARVTVPQELQTLCLEADIPNDTCMLTATIGQALAALKKGLQQYDGPIAVVVVGDHAPPIGGLHERLDYDQHKVPALAVFPRVVSTQASSPQP